PVSPCVERDEILEQFLAGGRGSWVLGAKMREGVQQSPLALVDVAGRGEACPDGSLRRPDDRVIGGEAELADAEDLAEQWEGVGLVSFGAEKRGQAPQGAGVVGVVGPKNGDL